MAKRTAQKKDPQDTPMMRQYLSVKEQYPDAILFYRMGDFYEMFFEDAVVAAEALDLTLTSRNKNAPDPIPMCGLPHHASLGYISRLIARGFKVAVCDQMEDPSKVKGLVKREVVRVITPGVILEEENLDAKSNNFLAAILPLGDDPQESLLSCAIATMDASTNEFKGTRVAGAAALIGELFRLEPREILVPKSAQDTLEKITQILPNCHISSVEDHFFAIDESSRNLQTVIGEEETLRLISQDELLAKAANAITAYVGSTRPLDALPFARFAIYNVADHMIIDEATKTHLELVRTGDGDKKGSLLWLLDSTRTGMGGRLLRNWINYPLCDVGAITQRLNRVDLFFQDSSYRSDVLETLSSIADIERIAARIGMSVATPRDLGVLRNSLLEIPHLDDLLTSCPAPDADSILGGPMDRAEDLGGALAKALVHEPPVNAKNGGIFQTGFDKTLDELTTTLATAKDFIADLEERERKRTGIASLKVSYNKVFGYFILVTKTNLKHVPEDYVRKQTLANGERFVTKELEEWEAKVLSADDKKKALEQDLFATLVTDLRGHITRLLSISSRVAIIDCSATLAHIARTRDFVRPDLADSGLIDIAEGRHPLVEAIHTDIPFVPNDVRLDPASERLLIITGPNMAGKSTVMRQVALITILAQMGSFVPASKATISVADRLFTRVGASDNIARGESTFMVEMNETSTILRSATSRSLVILDEVGRGTSTYDGLSIAWAVGEYLHDSVKCKTMFATHYHELVELANIKNNAANYHVAAREYGENVVFLRKLIEGGTSHSFGIQVAKMAGLPEMVVQRSREILAGLEKENPQDLRKMPSTAKQTPQLDLFSAPKPSEVEQIIKEIDVNRITPLEAISLVTRLKTILDE